MLWTGLSRERGKGDTDEEAVEDGVSKACRQGRRVRTGGLANTGGKKYKHKHSRVCPQQESKKRRRTQDQGLHLGEDLEVVDKGAQEIAHVLGVVVELEGAGGLQVDLWCAGRCSPLVWAGETRARKGKRERETERERDRERERETDRQREKLQQQ